MKTQASLSPAAERNKGPISEVLADVLPRDGRVLEIASGTGQHVLHFAATLSGGLQWQPTEADAARHAELAARLAASPQDNVLAPLPLDVERLPWPVHGAFDAVVCINMIHIAPYTATAALLRGAHAVLQGGGHGQLILYGPFTERGAHTASSNAAFDVSLRARHPDWGVRDLDEVTALAERAGFQRRRVVRMPANNLTVVFARGAHAPG